MVNFTLYIMCLKGLVSTMISSGYVSQKSKIGTLVKKSASLLVKKSTSHLCKKSASVLAKKSTKKSTSILVKKSASASWPRNLPTFWSWNVIKKSTRTLLQKSASALVKYPSHLYKKNKPGSEKKVSMEVESSVVTRGPINEKKSRRGRLLSAAKF